MKQELTTLLPKEEYGKRRERLLKQLPKNSIAILPAAKVKNRNNDADFPYRQDSDFYYLTGFTEESAVLVLIPGRKEGETVLFCRPRNREEEVWDGYRAGPEGAISEFGMEQAFSIQELDEQMLKLLDGRDAVYYSLGVHGEFDQRLIGWMGKLKRLVRRGVKVPDEMQNLDALVHEMRLIKSEAEIEHMFAAAEISAQAHVRAMKAVKPGMYEYQLEAELLHHFMHSGSRAPAYTSIVGAGANACILHYIENNSQIQDGDLILIDAGCELDHYASDITRTFPANGRFSTEQKAIYELVLNAQLAAIEIIKPGLPYDKLQETAARVITEGLVELGLLKGNVETLIKDNAYKRFYMHGVGHWIGMDVHDVGRYKLEGEWRPLKEGMVITVEPGIYIAPDDASVDEKWRGIGVRIEDDVVITKEGHRILSKSVPKSVSEIEALVGTA